MDIISIRKKEIEELDGVFGEESTDDESKSEK